MIFTLMITHKAIHRVLKMYKESQEESYQNNDANTQTQQIDEQAKKTK